MISSIIDFTSLIAAIQVTLMFYGAFLVLQWIWRKINKLIQRHKRGP